MRLLNLSVSIDRVRQPLRLPGFHALLLDACFSIDLCYSIRLSKLCRTFFCFVQDTGLEPVTVVWPHIARVKQVSGKHHRKAIDLLVSRCFKSFTVNYSGTKIHFCLSNHLRLHFANPANKKSKSPPGG